MNVHPSCNPTSSVVPLVHRSLLPTPAVPLFPLRYHRVPWDSDAVQESSLVIIVVAICCKQANEKKNFFFRNLLDLLETCRFAGVAAHTRPANKTVDVARCKQRMADVSVKRTRHRQLFALWAPALFAWKVFLAVRFVDEQGALRVKVGRVTKCCKMERLFFGALSFRPVREGLPCVIVCLQGKQDGVAGMHNSCFLQLKRQIVRASFWARGPTPRVFSPARHRFRTWTMQELEGGRLCALETCPGCDDS